MFSQVVQTPMPEMVALIIQYGVPSVVLTWFMIRAEAKLTRIDTSISIVSRTLLLSIVANSALSDTIKDQAKQLSDELEQHSRDARKSPSL